MILEKLIYFITLINETLPLSTAKELSRNWNKSRYDSLFGGKYRIYIPFTPPKINIDSGLNNPIAHALNRFLNVFGYEITDYLKGLCKKKGEIREQKIGKVLQKLKPEEMGFAKGDIKDLLNKFNNDYGRMAGTSNKLLIAISRHPYDIAGMSTGRDWESCMTLGPNGGEYQKYVPKEIAEGSIIAYLIKDDDKNIKRPIARIMIKPYFDKTKRVYLGIASRTYPLETLTGFKEAVEKWLESVQSKIQGIFKLSDRVYHEVDKTTIVRLPARVEELKKYITLTNGTTWDQVLKDELWILKAKDLKGRLELTKSHGKWFFRGVWEDGVWEDGVWKKGIFNNGIWKNGRWEDGTWVSGTWASGTWHNGLWLNGLWLNGTWERGTWKNGTWDKGVWTNGTWERGIWSNGIWSNGIWKGGHWTKGIWENGRWEGGTWDKGIIKYEGLYFKSKFDPNTFEFELVDYEREILMSLEEPPYHSKEINYSKLNYKKDGIEIIVNSGQEIYNYIKSK